ncbi:nuclear transport factor 2 family protein [Actinoplanes sp. NPDC049596]|uniref:nuclear transport factor 2 family protein n=1 Tax=unclassified Actinoplanes TaxID=2626549 RepID=UPI0034314002
MGFKIIFSGASLCLLLGGCGGAETPSAAVTPASAAASSAPVSTAPGDEGVTGELRPAVQAYSDAFLTGDAKKAYGLLSERCRKRMSQSEFTQIVTAAGQMYGSALPLETYSAKVSGDLARVTYTYSIKAINQEAEPWTRESGEWHQDDC